MSKQDTTCESMTQVETIGGTLTLSEGPQLLLDDMLVEDRFGLKRVLMHPAKYSRNPVLVADTPWEGEIPQISAVLWDEALGRYRMWYGSSSMSKYYNRKPDESYTFLAYAESEDGFNWRKPLFDLCPEPGHAKTNLLKNGGLKVILNPQQDDPERRFLGVGLVFRKNGNGPTVDGVNLLHSADGFEWKLSDDDHIFDSHSDTKNQMVFDPVRGRWLLYCRPSVFSSGKHSGQGRHHRRRVSVMVSNDLREWTYPTTVLCPDEAGLPDYDHVAIFRYGSHFLMLYVAMDGDDTGRMHLRLASSPDGIRWERFHTREDFIALGPAGTFDAGIVGAACGPVRQGDKMLIYYNGMNMGQHESFPAQTDRTGAGGVATLKADRFVAQRGGAEAGWLLTRQFILTGNTLRINMAPDTRPGRCAAIQVEVVKQPPRTGHCDYYVAEHDRKGYSHAYDGYLLEDCAPISVDRIDFPVKWNGRDLSELVGKPVYLRFRVQDADLFSFSITEE